MKPKLKDVLDMIELEELMKIKEDIEQTSGAHLKKLVEHKIRQKKEGHDEGVCSTCLGAVQPYAVENYSLVFGPGDFKKKASFCSIDCMNNFVKNLEKSKGISRGFSSSIRTG